MNQQQQVLEEITEFGRSLEPILVLMQDWGGEFKARRLAEESTEAEPATADPAPASA